MKKKISFLLFCLAIISSSVMAQGQEGQRREGFEKFKKEREEFLIKAMKLTDEEAKAFIPLADELQMKKFEANKELREFRRKLREARKEGKKVSEADYKKMIELGADARIKEAQLEKEYLLKFINVLSAEKAFQYQHAEQEFGQKMMERRQQQGHGGEQRRNR